MNLKIKLIIAAIAIVGSFSSGWATRGWYEDSKQLAVKEMADELIQRSRLREADIAAEVNNALSAAVLRERTVVRELQPIIERPVYEVDCIDTDGLDLINGLSRNDTD